MTIYTVRCDLCGKTTKQEEQDGWSDKEVAKNNWDISVYSNWTEKCTDMPGYAEWKFDREYRADACSECAKKAAQLLRDHFGFKGQTD